MRLVFCNSKKWFQLNEEISSNHEILFLENETDLHVGAIEKFNPDLIFFPHWSWKVKKEIFSRFKCIVFHTAPLPYGRGGSPIQNLIVRGHISAPVCALKMVSGLDEGPIYDKQEISLEGNLSEILLRLNSAVNTIIARLIINLPQPKEQIGKTVLFKRLGSEDNEIKSHANIHEFYDIIRMLDDSSYPSAYLSLDKVKMEFSEIVKEAGNLYCKVQISEKKLEQK